MKFQPYFRRLQFRLTIYSDCVVVCKVVEGWEKGDQKDRGIKHWESVCFRAVEGVGGMCVGGYSGVYREIRLESQQVSY